MNLHQATVSKAFWHYTLPSVAALMVSGTYQIVDGIFVGHFVGGNGLAAISLAWPLIGVLLAVGMMVGIGAGAHASIQLGARQPNKAREYLIQALFLLMGFSVLLGVVLFFISPLFLSFQGAEGEALLFGQRYLNWMLAGTPIVLGSIALPLLVRNAGAPRLATFAMGLGAVANIALDALFLGYLGYGLEGAALATLLGELLPVVLCLGYLCSRHSQLAISWGQLAWRSQKAWDLLKTGFSSMLMYLYISFSIVLHNMLLLQHGTSLHVAAFSIAGYLMTFYYLLAEGVAGGMQPITSFYHGAEQKRKIQASYRLACLIVLSVGLCFVLAVQWSPSFFAQFFISDTDTALLETTSHALRLFMLAMFLDGFLVITATWFQSLGQARPATMITLGNMAIQVPFLLLLPQLLGINGVWLAVPVSNVVLSSLVLILVVRQWRRLGNG
ncbi:MATE family efflux transporter [Vreelandella nigrificans]|uniref:Multidrug export protein MepA n=1 Tax=Vreelandella nigrificans TaxID=2042704 RepID=A0A2A4HJC2_9GAMM|nr:MATE family efflux transporter [Halomonas nigrificans]PCF95488.1 multidrug efflux protein [Halomonas nigrificans]